MTENSDKDPYSPANVIMATTSSWVASVAVIILVFAAINQVMYHHPSQLPDQNDLLVAGLWSTVANFTVAILLAKFNSAIKKIIPEWVAIPLAGTALFIFTWFAATYWNTVRHYSPGSTFSDPPPRLINLMGSATFCIAFIALPGIFVAFVAQSVFSRRDKGIGLQIGR